MNKSLKVWMDVESTFIWDNISVGCKSLLNVDDKAPSGVKDARAISLRAWPAPARAPNSPF
jgi:hypothetical protein